MKERVGSNSRPVPFQRYPQNVPQYLPKTKFADFMEYYTCFQEIPVWTSTTFLPLPSYDSNTRRWTVTLQRNNTEVTLRPKHLIMATGLLDKPNIPHFDGINNFQGKVVHTAHYKNAKESGKKMVIIGTVRDSSASCVTLTHCNTRGYQEQILRSMRGLRVLM